MQVRKYIFKLILSIAVILSSNDSFAAKTDFIQPDNGVAKSRIIASFYQKSTEDRQRLVAGFEVVINDGWKIYAPDNSGKTNFIGAPPSFNLTNSQNINIAKTQPTFPTAYIEKEQIGDETIEYSAYKEKIIIPLEIEVVDLDKKVNLEIEVNYALCKDICIPVSQKFSLEVPALQNDSEILENIQPYLENNQILIPKNPLEESPILQISLLKALLIAFIGGMILNIMPCVLPVLSIKLLSIINHNQSKLSRIRWAFFSTTLGIVFSFAAFACIAAFLKTIGNQVGWGFQFQNPYFLLFLLVVLMVFVANLIGLFEFNFGGSLGSVLNKKIIKEDVRKKNIFIPNFLSGILAVLLATPCSAPFVGVAVSFALSTNIKEIFLIFGIMSLGLASPYLFFIAFPQSVKLMPKPGAWMIKTKQLMAGFLAATAIWLVYILIDNIGFIAAMSAAILSILILLFFKIINKFNFSELEPRRHLLIIITNSIIFISLISSIFIIPNHLAYLNKMLEKQQQENWIKFDQSKIPDLVKQGKTVVVDITADWCITCKANKLLVLNSQEIRVRIAKSHIVAMRGDLTKPNEAIFDFMKEYNRYGIPFNIVFGPNAPNGILTSELLSKKSLLEIIDQASNLNPQPKQ